MTGTRDGREGVAGESNTPAGGYLDGALTSAPCRRVSGQRTCRNAEPRALDAGQVQQNSVWVSDACISGLGAGPPG